MPNERDEAEFTFSWLALRLLGRGLYSNPWSALSELVANGLDAGAQNVYVFVDARDKSDATVEVIDDGSGMSRGDISTYVKVGYNKRAQAMAMGVAMTSQFKGRKGIGKLAALYLSQHFFIQTRHEGHTSSWELDARDESVGDDDHPSLVAADTTPETANDELWAGQVAGTRITLLNVDLTGYGPQSISALGSRLANQFLLPTDGPPQVLLSVWNSGQESAAAFAPVEKSIAFGNLVDVLQNFPHPEAQPSELSRHPQVVKLRAKGLPGDVLEYMATHAPFPPDTPVDEALNQIEESVDLAARTYNGVGYELTGWIGLHASIDSELARQNDDRFVKNKFYNPAQLRVYVRGKLANDHLLTQLGITGTYANYIEGEITFDLLDDDALPDIATSNRQDFDETDSRVTLLRSLVRPLVRKLIQNRNDLAEKIAALVATEKARRDASGKTQFSEQLKHDLAHHTEIPEPVRDELHMVITNKIQGEVAPKTVYRVFLSHARADKAFASFVDEVLRARGATKDEIFYTSRIGDVEPALDDRALSEIIKKNLVDTNTLIFYMTSRNFLGSQFCLFEGGAGWATRSVSEYLKLNVDFSSIPSFLTNGKAEVTLLGEDGRIELRPDVHNYLIKGVLNPMIAHLNRGRVIAGIETIEEFQVSEFPSALELSRTSRVVADYFDSAISEHWQVLVESGIDQYLRDYEGPAPV